jgi:hypothetical protein
MENYPSNSNSRKKVVRQPEDKKIEKVTQGNIARRKKPLSKRFADIFVGGDAKSVWNYIAFDIMVPAAKDMLSDAVSSGIDQILFGGEQRWGGGPRRGRGRPMSGPLGSMSYGGTTGPVNYQAQGARAQNARPSLSASGRGSHNFDEILFERRADAEEVIESMFNLLNQYEVVSVAEMYELVGATSHFTDNKWGWTSLQGAGVARARSGFVLDLPRPEPLD